jgi:hypothetical protein
MSGDEDSELKADDEDSELKADGEDSELKADDKDSELKADDREGMEAAELDNIELTTDELEDLDPKPDPPPQAVRVNKTANKLKRLTIMVITPLWFFGKSSFTTAGWTLGTM